MSENIKSLDSFLENLSNYPIEFPTVEELQETATRASSSVRPFYPEIWYDTFSDVTPETVMVTIPEQFIEILKTEQYISIPELVDGVQSVINYFGGTAFVKLSTRSPKDLSNCIFIDADSALHDLAFSMRTSEDLQICYNSKMGLPSICIRRVKPYNANNEYRCFVKNNTLIGITEYDYTGEKEPDLYFPDAVNSITEFYHNIVQPRWSAISTTSDYVFDVHIGKDRIELIEFNPYGLSDPCYFKTYGNVEDPNFEHNHCSNFFKNNPSICEFVVSSRLIKE